MCVSQSVGTVVSLLCQTVESFIKKQELLYLNFVNVLDVFGVVQDSHGHGNLGNIREHLWFTGLEKSWKLVKQTNTYIRTYIHTCF